MRPCPSTGTRTSSLVPKPSIRRLPTVETCTSSPTTTVIRGARCRPSRSTSQPARRSTSWRAAARQVKLAMWQPVTKPTVAVAGRPSSSSTQPATMSSSTATAGDIT